jgi:protein-S-isoprenylcysteine O-methyltransferase Ste14
MIFPKPYADFAQRLRVPAGFVLLITFAWLSQPSRASMEAGLPISLLGLLLRAWAAGHLAKNRELATSGPFAYVRNPLYLGTLITAAGLVVAARQLWLALLFAAVFLLVYLPAIELEEQHLRQIFPSYAAYSDRVRRFLPLSKWPGPQTAFSWSLYRRNEEYKALAGFIIAVGWLIWKCGRDGL